MKNWLSQKSGRYFFLISLFVFIGTMISTAQWIKQSPIPTGADIRDACFISPDTGWIFGYDGTILRTNDAGLSWIDQSSSMYSLINSGLFLDANHGWIACYDNSQNNYGKIFGTIDGGYSWNLQFSDIYSSIRELSFINPDIGWALCCRYLPNPSSCGNYFLKTINGGQNWFVLDSIDQCFYNEIDFINDTMGYIAGAGMPNLMKTLDGGLTWQASPHVSDASLTDLFFTDLNNGYSCGNNFYYTHNSGAGWNYTYCYHSYKVDMYDALNGWTISLDKIYKVTNGGSNVDYQYTMDKNLLLHISALDSANAYAIGRYVSICTTHDGTNWHEISNGTQNDLFSIFFLGENEGWVSGSDHTFMHTTDGGEHWDFIGSPFWVPVMDIQFINPDTGWMVGDDIYRTTNGGEYWQYSLSTAPDIRDLYFLDSQLGWCVGNDGIMYKSMDGGISWEEKISRTDKDLNAVSFVNQSIGWIAGDRTVLKTIDGGESWEESYAGYSDFLKIQFFDENVGYILADRLYLKTYTGGEYWHVVIPEGMSGLPFEDFCFIDQDIGYLSADYSLLKTTNGGESWESATSLPDMQTHAIFFTNEMDGWLVGANGAIYHTKTGGTVSVKGHNDGAIPSSYNIFPNPTSGKIKITYKLESTKDVEIGIYNLQGLSISNYKEIRLNPGIYSYDWNPANLPPGIYLCKIRIGDCSDTKKIVYIK